MLDIEMDLRSDVLFIRLFGKLTKDNSLKLNRKVTNLINDIGISNIVINMQNLSYADCYGMRAIKKCYNMCDNSLLCVNPVWFNKIENLKFVTDEKDVMYKNI